MSLPDKWHRIGVMMSIAALVAVVAMGVVLNANLPANWHVVTEHSDRPEQVMGAMDGLEAEINERLVALEFARGRAIRKAEEHRQGITEPGEEKSEARIAELKAKSPEWAKAAEHASTILNRVRAQGAPRVPLVVSPSMSTSANSTTLEDNTPATDDHVCCDHPPRNAASELQ